MVIVIMINIDNITEVINRVGISMISNIATIVIIGLVMVINITILSITIIIS